MTDFDSDFENNIISSTSQEADFYEKLYISVGAAKIGFRFPSGVEVTQEPNFFKWALIVIF